jgi:hypothetical protein
MPHMSVLHMTVWHVQVTILLQVLQLTLQLACSMLLLVLQVLQLMSTMWLLVLQ